MTHSLFQILITLKVEMDVHKNEMFSLSKKYTFYYIKQYSVFYNLLNTSSPNNYFSTLFFSLVSQLHI